MMCIFYDLPVRQFKENERSVRRRTANSGQLTAKNARREEIKPFTAYNLRLTDAPRFTLLLSPHDLRLTTHGCVAVG